jgi:uncharacterized protein
MKWDDTRRSENVEDRRDSDPTAGGGGLGQMFGGGGRLGIGAIIIAGLLSYFTGINFNTILGFEQMFTGGGTTRTNMPQPSGKTGVPADQMGNFVSAVLGETEDVWGKVLPAQKNVRYTAPKLVLFNGETASSCGRAEAAMGPFYCPEDQKVYLDMSFFQEMRTKFGGGGDFAYAYVIAHEIGHHVENQLGILPKIQQLQEQASSQAQSNALSVRVELLADCLAGVWAANANQQWKILEPGDVEKAIATAQAIGDDKLQQKARGRVVPDSFTHGSAAQRQQWLTAGLQSGQIDACMPLLR